MEPVLRMIEPKTNNKDSTPATFIVFGVGGGGGNAVEHMVQSGVSDVNFVCANTDSQALAHMSAPIKLQLGVQSTRGLGAGANPDVGRTAAEEERDSIRQYLTGMDMAFITAGMGGGTGTGAAPVIAEIAKEMGILTVAVVTTPFDFEGRRRIKSAEKGIEALSEHVDSLIIIPNQKLLDIYGELTKNDALKKADDVLLNAVRSIHELITVPGSWNLDFADLKTTMSSRGYAMMGMGIGRGEDRARQAAEAAIRSPLLDNICLRDAKGIIINIKSSEDLKLNEIQRVADIVEQIADMEHGQVIYGTVTDPTLKDELHVTVIATGLSRNENAAPAGVPTVSAAQYGSAHIPQTPSMPIADEEPAITRRTTPPVVAEVAPTPAPAQPAPRPASVSIQDFLNRQQKR